MGKHLLTYETNKEYDDNEVVTTLIDVRFLDGYYGSFDGAEIDSLTMESDKSYTCNIYFPYGPAGSSSLTSVNLKSERGFFARITNSAKTAYTYEGEVFADDNMVYADIYDNNDEYWRSWWLYPTRDKNGQLIGYGELYDSSFIIYTGTTNHVLEDSNSCASVYEIEKITKYLEGTVNSVTPGVSYTLENEQVCYNPLFNYITVTYDVQSTEEETFLYNPNGIDGDGSGPGAGVGMFGSSRGVEDTAATEEVVLMPTENTLLGAATPIASESTSSGQKTKVVSMEIDGVLVDDIVSAYTFSTTGIHVIKFGVATTTGELPEAFFMSGYGTCYGSECYIEAEENSIIKIELSEGFKSIGDYCFGGCPLSSGISLPSTLKKIGMQAFYKVYDLPEITFPSGLKSLGARAFENATIKSDFNLPESLKSIGNQCFTYSNLARVPRFPGKITKIPVKCFYGAQFQNTTVSDFGTNVNAIAEEAFSYTNLTEVSIPGNIKVIGNCVFKYCNDLTSITFNEGVEKIGLDLLDSTSVTDVAFPNSLRQLGVNIYDKSMGYVHQLVPSTCTAVTFGNGLEIIGDNAFAGANITSVVLPESIKVLGTYCFRGTKLTGVTLPPGLTTIPSNCFASTPLTEIVIPEGVVNIDGYAFSQATSLTSVTLPNSLKNLGIDCFEGCSGLTTITIPDGVVTIDSYAFSECQRLTSVTFGSAVETIGNAAFRNCNKLTTITLPTNLKHLGTLSQDGSTWAGGTFSKCTGLTTINIPSGVSEIGTNCFSGCTRLATVNFDDANSVRRIGSNAFNGTPFINNCPAIGGIRYPVPKVAYSCSNTSATAYTVQEGTVAITYGCFAGCRSATAITLPNSIEFLGGQSFQYTVSLTGITIPGSVKENGGGGMFYGSGVRNIVVEEGATFFPDVYSAINLTSVTIPSTIVGLNGLDGNFTLCPSLTGANGSCPLISADHKYLCSGSTLISFVAGAETAFTVPNEIEWFGDHAFSNTATKLVSLTMHSGFKGVSGCKYADDSNSCFGALSSLSSMTFYTSQIPFGFTGGYNAYASVQPNGVLRCPAGTQQEFSTLASSTRSYGIPASKNWTIQEMS